MKHGELEAVLHHWEKSSSSSAGSFGVCMAVSLDVLYSECSLTAERCLCRRKRICWYQPAYFTWSLPLLSREVIHILSISSTFMLVPSGMMCLKRPFAIERGDSWCKKLRCLYANTVKLDILKNWFAIERSDWVSGYLSFAVHLPAIRQHRREVLGEWTATRALPYLVKHTLQTSRLNIKRF